MAYDTMIDLVYQLTQHLPLRCLSDQITESQHPLDVLLAALPCFISPTVRINVQSMRSFWGILRHMCFVLPQPTDVMACRPALSFAQNAPREHMLQEPCLLETLSAEHRAGVYRTLQTCVLADNRLTTFLYEGFCYCTDAISNVRPPATTRLDRLVSQMQ